MEAIILAGGLGTRLRSAVPDVPKCMAPINGKPFLHYVINYLQQKGVTNFVFSLGYLHHIIEDYLQNTYPNLQYTTVIETEPLGTGGAIALALQKTKEPNVITTNGDTLFEANLKEQFTIHNATKAACTLALKPMQQFDRYGVVTINNQQQITSFQEKKYYETGLINGGLYCINKQQFLSLPFSNKFSFEKDFLEAYVQQLPFFASVEDAYFIDIGIPADFEKAQADFATKF
jgi:D-glycero-alpha-D-manno-heptose 1-phosphate guanylyltransferase